MPTRHDLDAVRRRDEGRARVSRLTRWLAAGALVLTGACSVLAAKTLPGSDDSTSASATTSSSSSTDTGSTDSSDGSGLQAAGSSPSAASGSADATSGGS